MTSPIDESIEIESIIGLTPAQEDLAELGYHNVSDLPKTEAAKLMKFIRTKDAEAIESRPSQIQIEMEEKYGYKGMAEKDALVLSKMIRDARKQKEAQLEKETEKLENVLVTSLTVGVYVMAILAYSVLLGITYGVEIIALDEDVTFWSFVRHHWVAIGIAFISLIGAIPLLFYDELQTAMVVMIAGALISILMIVAQIYNLQEEQMKKPLEKLPHVESQDNMEQ